MQSLTTIIGVSGKKQSGKSSLCKYISCYYNLLFLNSFSEEELESLIQSKDGEKVFLSSKNYLSSEPVDCEDIIKSSYDLYRPLYSSVINSDEKQPRVPVKVYSFADPIKDMCVNILNLREKQVNGTDAEKNSVTPYHWDNIPSIFKKNSNSTGFMTARQVMQFLGTDIFREMFSQNVWVDACIKNISKESPKIALIADVRFPSEADAILKAGGLLVRLTRSIYQDEHKSENALNDYFSEPHPYVCKVPDVDIFEKNRLVLEFLNKNIKTEKIH